MTKVNFLFLSIALLVTAGCKNASSSKGQENVNSAGTAQIVFKEYEHQFGKVAEGEKISYQFSFNNAGNGDLVLSSVTTSCGCTVPRYSKKPIKPGESGTIEVVFDTSGRNGMQTKTITVNSNASVPVVLLRITAEVETEITNQ
ncbi:MAG TPA: DUF1573 domain-containing protein [Bacteroidales bacterium]|nr:DUF1573 domain-containing protein [Bacteroidales bacterium]